MLEQGSLDVLFPVLPFLDISRPAIGVSLLQAQAIQEGFSSRILYLNHDLAERIGSTAYRKISEGHPSSLVGEWFFADTAFGDTIPPEEEYLSQILPGFTDDEDSIPQLIEARKIRYEFIEACVRKIEAVHPRVVGFTTTFHQTCACLAVARRLKESANPPTIIFGGANCEGVMGWQLLRSFAWIDYVCTGQGDAVFPEFLRCLLKEGRTPEIPGILRQDANAELTLPRSIENMDDLPYPDYSEYFERLGQFAVRRNPNRPLLREHIEPTLMVETSRGCWWGAKHHCTFCGLNGGTMAYRSKSPQRAFDEMAFLSRAYGVKRLDSVDNILDMRYMQTLFPKLIDSGLKLELFYEVKANLRFDQLATMRAAGIRAIQPGIESLSNQVLRIMNKGCTGLQNIQLLRWSEELGIQPSWNILAGFPGESPSEYDRLAEIVPLLVHLTPPTCYTSVRLDRFSPFFSDPESFGFSCVRPERAYYYVFPLGTEELLNLAYYFCFDYPESADPGSYMSAAKREVELWKQSREQETFLLTKEGVLKCVVGRPEDRPHLDAWQTGDEVEVIDTRPCAVQPSHYLTGVSAQVFLLCDSAESVTSICRRLAAEFDRESIQAAITELVSAKLMIEMGGQFLSLAVLRNRPAVRPAQEPSSFIQIQAALSADSTAGALARDGSSNALKKFPFAAQNPSRFCA
jgi:ribosomal peptide maturation radical SAM protein 1